MAEITLSSAVRANLLSLQGTADLLSTTQGRLSTGLKVNSALDDPTAFFTASSLNNRAGDLNRLQDFTGNAVQTIKAADKGISAITKLVEAAEAAARQALQTTAPDITTTNATKTGSATLAADTSATVTSSGKDYSALDVSGDDGENIVINGTTVDLTALTDGDSVKDAINAIDGITAVLDGTDLKITVDDDSDLVISGTATGLTATGLTAATTEATNTTLGALTGDVTFKVGSGATTTITFGTDDGAGEVNNRKELAAALTLASGTLEITANKLVASATTTDDLVIGGDAAILTALGLSAETLSSSTSVGTPSTERTDLAATFDDLRTQITQLAADASFNGVNLLGGDSLTVTFNEEGTSTLSITGTTFSATGLSISASAGDFQKDTDINAAITELKAATTSLRTQASKFGTNLSIVEARQDFTKNLINVLEEGAANLTLADTNQEAANLLALQTRQALSQNSLRLASQADQSVLQLVR